MTSNLLTNTATLIVKIPGYVDIPAYQEKSRVKRSIVRSLIRSLQLKDLSLVYAGFWPEDAMEKAARESDGGTLLSINILNPGRAVSEFNHNQETLIRRFKKELQNNCEHILIDRPSRAGEARQVEIYLKSKFREQAPQQHYSFAVSSGTYALSPAF